MSCNPISDFILCHIYIFNFNFFLFVMLSAKGEAEQDLVKVFVHPLTKGM